MDDALLNILACPETKQALHLAEKSLVERLNHLIQTGALRNRKGDLIKAFLDGGLVREDGRYIYPIRQKIPILMIEEGIALQENVENPKS